MRSIVPVLLAGAALAACSARSGEVAAASAQPPPESAAAPATPVEPGARGIARNLYNQLARQMSERAGRVVEAEERRQGLGGMLVGYDLYEAPRASAFPGLCEVSVHQIAVAPVQPGTGPEQPPTARSERTLTRYYAIGSTLPQQAAGADGRDGCGRLPTARNFFDAPSGLFAEEAVRTFEAAQLWSRTTPAGAVLRCTAAGGPCGAPDAHLQALSVQRLRNVAEAECPAALPGRGTTCFVYQVDQPSGPAQGSWIVTIRGPQRPLQVDIRPAPVVVT